MVNKHIKLENLQRKKGPSGDLREKLSRKDNQGRSKKPIWDRLCDSGVNSTKNPHASNSQREFDFPSASCCNINRMISLVGPHQERLNQELIYASKQG
ncbi:hypothetical protein LIER_38142 [Lithospermum erythrorhizon]|uniref:Uncharacterized protein n=1 Tax=Lithospermum erythrorhizon TaxID=34254 RepID=A0AAV3PVQ9_LITER